MKSINLNELQLMTNTIASMKLSNKSYEIYITKSAELNRWTIKFFVLIDDEIVDEMIVNKMRSDNPKTYNVLEDCLIQIMATCTGIGSSGRLKLNLQGKDWEMKYD